MRRKGAGWRHAREAPCWARAGLTWLQLLALRQAAAVPMGGGRANLLRGNHGERTALPTLPGTGLRLTSRTAADPPATVRDGSCTAVYKEVQKLRAAGLGNTVGDLIDVACDEHGYYTPVQARFLTGEQWCVDSDSGKELPGTRIPPSEQPSLEPEACLKAAHPPKPALGLHDTCQTNNKNGPCDEHCWWHHCRVQPDGYCPTCGEGLTCHGDITSIAGYMIGSCEPDDAPDPCVDDPEKRLSTVHFNCGLLLDAGLCDFDLGIMFESIFPLTTMAEKVCPQSCGSCPPPPSPTPPETTAETMGDIVR